MIKFHIVTNTNGMVDRNNRSVLGIEPKTLACPGQFSSSDQRKHAYTGEKRASALQIMLLLHIHYSATPGGKKSKHL